MRVRVRGASADSLLGRELPGHLALQPRGQEGEEVRSGGGGAGGGPGGTGQGRAWDTAPEAVAYRGTFRAPRYALCGPVWYFAAQAAIRTTGRQAPSFESA